MKYAVRHEVAVMKKLSEKYMSDEETDGEDDNTLIRKSPGWRSTALNKLIAKLDRKYSRKKDSSKPAKKRIDGTLSNRTPPTNAPRWAVVREVSTSESTAATDDDQYNEVTDSAENDNSQTSMTDSGENSTAIISSPTSTHSVTDSGESRPTNNSNSSDHNDESEDEDEDLNEIFQAVGTY